MTSYPNFDSSAISKLAMNFGVFVCAVVFFELVKGAGYADGRASGADATTLHLNNWESPRKTNAQQFGGGLETVQLTADVVVAGGGSAGTSAALASARNGAKTIVVQSRKVLGGNAASESKLHMVGANKQGARGEHLKTEARESGIVEEYTLDNCVSNPQRCAENLDLTLYDLFRKEPNIYLLLNTFVVGCVKDETNTITTVIAEDQSAQLRYIINGKPPLLPLQFFAVQK